MLLARESAIKFPHATELSACWEIFLQEGCSHGKYLLQEGVFFMKIVLLKDGFSMRTSPATELPTMRCSASMYFPFDAGSLL